MVLPDLYKEIDFERYVTMLSDMVEGCCIEMTVVDDCGQIIWGNLEHNNDIENFARSISLFNKNRECSRCRLVGGKDKEVFAYCSLGRIANRHVGHVIYSIVTQDETRAPKISKLLEVLSKLSALISDEWRYLYEVNSLAIELGDRYDELAMLRSTESPVLESRESRHILSSYIRKYAEHVDIDYACIWIPSRQYFFPAGRLYSPKDSANEQTLHTVARCVFGLIDGGLDTVGINDNADALLNHAELDINKKILAVPVLNNNGEICGVLVSLNGFNKRDFTYSDRTTAEAVCKKIYKYLDSTEDPLTHLYNKTGFEDSVWRDIRISSSAKHLALINLRQFNVINGAYGTDVGDSVLQQVGVMVAETIQGRGFAARIEADHFALLVNKGDSESVKTMLKALMKDIADYTFRVENKTFSITARCSIMAIDDDSTTLSDCIYSARLALETAADDSGNEVVSYQPSNAELVKRKRQMGMVENIKHALDENRFTLYAQNIRTLKDSHDHYEILVRMLDENGDIVPPNDFIPTAERYKLMPLVDKWVFHHTLTMLDEYDVHHSHPEIKWGINLSGDSMSDKGFLDHVSKTIRNTSMCATNLYFEITETAVIENYQNFTSFMNQVHSMGCQFALDDFGSGLCSFSYLKKLAVDYLKIDGSLVKDIVSSDLDHTIVSSVASIANVMGVKTIAEYVENDAIIAVLKQLGIDYAQGFGIMKPLPLNEVIEGMQRDMPALKKSSG